MSTVMAFLWMSQLLLGHLQVSITLLQCCVLLFLLCWLSHLSYDCAGYLTSLMIVLLLPLSYDCAGLTNPSLMIVLVLPTPLL